jgi:hypothetical protein
MDGMKKCENPLIPELQKTFKKRQFNLSSIKLPEGLRKVCVWCLGPLKGQQRRWCGNECVEAAQAWAYPQKEWGLGILLLRQNFKCNTCQFDWGAVVEAMYQKPRVPYGMVECKDTWRTKFSYWLTVKLKDEMHLTDLPHRIEVDHIVAISKGGQALGLDNHQAICYTCHKVKTKQDLSGKRVKND